MKSRNLLALGVMTTLLSVQAAKAEFFLCQGGVKKSVEETSAEAKNEKMSRMDKLQEQLKGTTLEYSLNLPTAQLADYNFDFGVNRSSEQTISGKYSQADVWRLGVSTNLLGTDPNANLGLWGTITYVRQFNTRAESICNDVPFYDPTKKVPQSAADFDLNRADALKVGELIEFETQLVLGIPEWATASISKLKILSPFSMEGRFKVQLFRMSPNLVRVRVKTIQDRTGRLGIKYRILDLPGVLGKKTEIEAILHQVSFTEMEVIDTVFNFEPKLNNALAKRGKKTAAELYDSLIGSKMQLKLKNTLNLILEAVKMNIPYDKYRDEVMAELGALLEASKEDACTRRDGKCIFNDKGRRVFLISKAEARGTSRLTGISANLLNAARIRVRNYDHESFMSITESSHQTNNFLLHGLGKFSEWKVLKLFGKTFGVSTNLILRAPEGVNPKDYEAAPVQFRNNGENYPDYSQVKEAPKMPLTAVYGLQLSRQLKDQDFTVDEARHLRQMLKDQLTDKIFERLKWYAAKDAAEDNDDEDETTRQTEKQVDPQWDSFTSKAQSNVELTQDIVFKDSIFTRYNRGSAISQGEIEARIREILNKKAANKEDLKSIPAIIKQVSGMPEHPLARDAETARIAKDQRRYNTAYAEDIKLVAQLLANILNTQDTRYRYETYKMLIQNELFMEIGGIIMMYVNENTLAQDVAVKIVLGAQSRQPIIGYFPNKETYEQLKVFGAVIDYQNQLTDRSYNLSSFFNEAGNPISLHDLLLKSTDVNLVETSKLPLVGDQSK